MNPVYWDTEILPALKQSRPCELLFFVLPIGYKPAWAAAPKTLAETNLRASMRLPERFVFQWLQSRIVASDPSLEASLARDAHLELYLNSKMFSRIPLPQEAVDIGSRMITPQDKFFIRAHWRGPRPEIPVDVRMRVELHSGETAAG